MTISGGWNWRQLSLSLHMPLCHNVRIKRCIGENDSMKISPQIKFALVCAKLVLAE